MSDAKRRFDQQNPISSPSIPLPNEVPPPPDLSSLPPSVLHAGTVETLLGLNEDLMARLKVNIRRNGILEQQLLEQERTNEELLHTNHALGAQIDVLQEKETNSRDRLSETQALRMKLEGAIDELTLLRAYRRRIDAWVRPAIDQAKRERIRTRAVETTLAARDSQISDLRARMQETITHLQNQEKQHQRDQKTLVERYEERLRQYESELDAARPKAARFAEATATAAEATNRIVFLERRAKDLEERLGSETKILQEQLAKYRLEAKQLAVEALQLSTDLRESQAANAKLAEENRRQQDQFESLQAVWTDAQKRLEASKLQQESFNRLNQELSRQLKELRAAGVRPVATEVAPVDSASRKRIENLLVEIESGFSMKSVGVDHDVETMHGLEILESPSNGNEEAPSPTAPTAPL